MFLEKISAQAAMGSTSESEELSDDGYDPLSGPLGLGGTLNNSLGDRDHFEQQIFSSPHSSVSLGHTSTPMPQEVLEGQKARKEQQNTVEAHLAELQSKMEESATSTPYSSDGKSGLLHEPYRLVVIKCIIPPPGRYTRLLKPFACRNF